MPDDLDQPPRGYTTADVPTQRERPRKRWRTRLILAAVVIVPVLLFALYTWITLTYAYSRGERAGYVQKFSKKGWICKTWEGELAMVNLPGAAQEKFYFSVRDDAIAQRIERDMGRRVSLSYEQHRGVPTSCFGETEYFVTNVRPAE
jgi:hypothetical protein